MEPREVLEVLVAVVATLGELVATVTAPCRSVWPVMYPMSLHNDLRRFTWTLRDTLAHPDFVYLGYRDITSLYRRGVTDLGWALAALGDTQWVTWADVRATARGWREMVDGLAKSWFWVAEEAMELRDTWKNAATNEATDEATATTRARGLQDEPTGWGTAGDNLVAATQRPPETLASALAAHEARMAAATKAMEEAVVAISQARAATRRLRVEEVRGLLERLVAACDRATMFPRELQRRLRDIEATLKGTKEASRDVPKALVAAVAEAECLWEGIARLTMRHLLVTLGDIQHLLWRPYGSPGGPGGLGGPGGSGGSISPGGPGGRVVAEQCQKAIEDIPRLCKIQRTGLSCGETNNGSPITGTPEQPEGTWGNPEPGAVGETASHPPSDPDLLPPGARCVLATSKSINFLKNSCHECIPVGVTGTSQQRQDFLIIGKDSNRIPGLSVLPAVISVNCNEELSVLALAQKAPMVIQPKTPIAIAIALPMNTNKQAGYREMPLASFSPAPNVCWIKRITSEEPELTCSLTHLGKTVKITGILDTGADVTVISDEFWPSDWNLVTPVHTLTGFGGATACQQSESMITVTGPKGKTASIRPYLVKRPITVWGRDVLSQWGIKIEVDS